MLLPSQPELPPKSMSTLNSLTVKRMQLSGELSSHCISDHHGCYDLARAKDFLRSYACLFYELLKKDYSERIATYNWEQEIADEAIQITLKVWSSFEVSPHATTWVETLDSAIVQHVGRPLRALGASIQLLPPSAYAAAQSPLLAMIAERGAAQNLGSAAGTPARPAPNQSEAERRANLLAAYKKVAGNPSNRKIYEAHNSGIHKPEFYQWVNGLLSAKSVTTQRFEAFLKAGRKPIPRKPTMGD